MLTLLLLSVGSAFAFADAPEEPPASFLPSGIDSAADLAPLIAGSEPVDVKADTNPTVAGELPHADLNRTEAEELLEGVFGADEVEASAEFFDELDIEAFRSDNVAVVAPAVPGAEPGLLFSTLPLRTTDESGEETPVDLGLEASEGGLEPANPLVELQIPTQLADGISLPEAGVTVELAGGEVDRAASELGDASVFYPNVATDTDFVVAAVPTGFETYTHLRSPDAPTEQKFDLDVPAGAELRGTDDGGAEVVLSDGSVALSVSAPSAVDAEGSDVPAEIEVEGNSVLLSANPGPMAAFPILVDPIFDIYNFTSTPTQGAQGKPWIGSPTSLGFGTSWGNPKYGMNAIASGGVTNPGNNAWFNVYVPRYWTEAQAGLPEPTSYIKNLKLWYLTFNMPDEVSLSGEARAPYPSMQLGLWANNKFVAYGERFGNESPLTDLNYVYELKNPNENTNVKNGGFGIATWASYNNFFRYVNVQQASVELTDQDAPGFGSISGPTAWMNAAAVGKINYVVSDPGLGIYTLKVKQPSAEGGSDVISTSNGGCVGTAQTPCPRKTESATRTIAYSPQTMAQGENYVEVTATDPVNHVSSPAAAKIKVDHNTPAISLAGSLTEQATLGTNLPEYVLTYNATDGDDAPAAPQAPFGTQGAGPGQLERPQGVAVDAEGNTWVTDKVRTKIIAYDKTGKLLREFGVKGSADGQINEPRGIAVGPNGNLWVAESGNKRIQQFTPTGTFVSKIARAEFAAPWGVATGPGGVVWMTDEGSRKVFRFKEDGTLLDSQTLDSGSLKFGLPYGIDVDAFGNGWLAMQSTHKILELSPTLDEIHSFGGEGTGPGQFRYPTEIAIADSGNVLVSDDQNGRVQVFKPDGSFLRQMGSVGAGLGQLTGPRGIDVGPGNQLVVADADNKRIARWSHADQDPQSGTAKVVVKVDGTTVHAKEPGCATKNCAVSGNWTLDADEFAGGAHKVEVTATDAVGIAQTKTLDIETHGDHTAPAIALSGTMTQQESIGTTRPSYQLKAVATDAGPAAELKSGVASTTIKVDGTVVDSSSPGCPAGDCSITREWTLNSESYSVGSHTVEVKATDAVGRVTTKTLMIDIARDTTAPDVSYMGAFYSAPSGWLEQKEVGYGALAWDKGYGVTSVELKIDGAVVNSVSGTCAAGGCLKFFASGQTLDISEYSGGAHPAEFIARDGAGNSVKRTWTLNVDPDGHISVSEAEDTLEALDATSPLNTVGESEEEDAIEGTAPGLEMTETEGQLVTTGGANSTEVASSPGSPLVVNAAAPSAYEGECGEASPVESEGSEPSDPDAVPADGSSLCDAREEGVSLTDPFLAPVEITPVDVSSGATETNLSQADAASVSANVAPHVDFITRPLYDGSMTFAAIRDAGAGETFSWQVELSYDQEIKAIDNTHLAVYYEDGPRAFTISAISAHDAVGSAVPTSLTTDGGNIITLTVGHRGLGPDGKRFVYPVVGGAGWEGGFQTYSVVMPPNTEVEAEEEGVSATEGAVLLISQGPPVPESNNPDVSLLKAGNDSIKKKFKFVYCKPHEYPGGAGVAPEWPEIVYTNGKDLPMVVSECNNPELEGIFWKVSAHGWFHFIRGEWVWLKASEWNCEKGGEEKDEFKKVNCAARFTGEVRQAGSGWATKAPIKPMGNFRFPPGKGSWDLDVSAVCFTEGGVLSSNPYPLVNNSAVRPLIWEKSEVHWTEDCDWPGY